MQTQISLTTGDAKATVRSATDLIERIAKTAPDGQNTPQLLNDLNRGAYIARGAGQAQLRNYDAARQDFMIARDMSPRSTDAYVNLAAISAPRIN